MGKTVYRTVFVTDESGKSHKILPGSELPEWAEEQVTNERVFVAPDKPKVSDPDEGAVVPTGGATGGDPVPSADWTHAELDDYADSHSIEWSSASLNKADKLVELGFD